MADICDQADSAVEAFQREALSRRHKEPEYTGYCLNCNEPTDLPDRWCDTDCREDWEKRTRQELLGPVDDDEQTASDD